MRLLLTVSACLLSLSLCCQTGDARVLVIGIDGTRPDCLEAAETPSLDALIADGIYSPDALNNDITYSGPGWSAMLCGVWSDAHGVTSNNFVGSDFDGFPSFMRRLELENPDFNTHSICHWSPINDYILGEVVDEAINAPTDAAVRDAAVSILDMAIPTPYSFTLTTWISTATATDSMPPSPSTSVPLKPQTAMSRTSWPLSQTVLITPKKTGSSWYRPTTGASGSTTGVLPSKRRPCFFLASGNAVEPTLVLKDTLDILPAPENWCRTRSRRIAL